MKEEEEKKERKKAGILHSMNRPNLVSLTPYTYTHRRFISFSFFFFTFKMPINPIHGRVETRTRGPAVGLVKSGTVEIPGFALGTLGGAREKQTPTAPTPLALVYTVG